MSIQYKHLGRTGLKVSPLCLGTMNFGPQTSEPDSYAIMDKALELGIQFWDSADVYGGKKGQGLTEQILGRYFAQGNRRESVVLATKVHGDMETDGRRDPNLQRGLSALKIIKGCEASLKRLQTDYIDLYQMHHVFRECPFEEIWQAMETLVKQGKILYVGSSNFAGWDIATAQWSAKSAGFPMGLVCEQSVYNLDNRTVELEVIPACRHYGLGLIPWSPLAGGLLGGVLQKQAKGRTSGEGAQKKVESKRKQLEAYEGFCKELGEYPADVGLAWLLHNPVVTAPIIGPRTMDQLVGSVRATEIRLDSDAMKMLDGIFPGPGGEAPKAYSW